MECNRLRMKEKEILYSPVFILKAILCAFSRINIMCTFLAKDICFQQYTSSNIFGLCDLKQVKISTTDFDLSYQKMHEFHLLI